MPTVNSLLNVGSNALLVNQSAIHVTGNNIANVDTPGYKRQDVAFESVLQQALGNNRYQSMDDKVANVNLSRLRGRAYVDYANYSYRLDGNNVDIENENVMLAENQLKYQGLISSINQEFTNLQTVMK